MLLASFADSRVLQLCSDLLWIIRYILGSSSRTMLELSLSCPGFREAESWVSWATLGDRSERIVVGGMVVHLQAIDGKRCHEQGQAIEREQRLS